MNKSESIKELAGALAKAQAEMPAVKMNSVNPFLKNKYADLGAVIETSRPVIAKHGLSISQFPVNQEDRIGVTSILMHSSGEWLEESLLFSTGEQKGLSPAQSAGVNISYVRRYAWAAILGLVTDEDTDGHSSNGTKPDVILEKKPAPEVRTPAPATDIQKLKADFSVRFKDAKALGITLPSLSGGAKEEEIKAAIANADKLIATKKNGQAEPA